MNKMPDSLLAGDDSAPVTVYNENGQSPILIVADHAGNSVPRALGRLGVPQVEYERHIAWDIGIAAVSAFWRTRSTPLWYSRIIRVWSSTAAARQALRRRFRKSASLPPCLETST